MQLSMSIAPNHCDGGGLVDPAPALCLVSLASESIPSITQALNQPHTTWHKSDFNLICLYPHRLMCAFCLKRSSSSSLPRSVYQSASFIASLARNNTILYPLLFPHSLACEDDVETVDPLPRPQDPRRHRMNVTTSRFFSQLPHPIPRKYCSIIHISASAILSAEQILRRSKSQSHLCCQLRRRSVLSSSTTSQWPRESTSPRSNNRSSRQYQPNAKRCS